MARNLDLTALRAFAAVSDAGGVTRAAGLLNLTQSAVSMQIRRLEDSLGVPLFFRAQRRLTLTSEGEQLLGFARRMLVLNDEALGRMGLAGFEGEVRLGVPHDIIYPAIPEVLKRLSAQFPRFRINLRSSFTLDLKAAFARGECDMILTTEQNLSPGGEALSTQTLSWVGAKGGMAWSRRPLRLAFKDSCIFRPTAQTALDTAGIVWEPSIEGESDQAAEAMVAADLAVTARIQDRFPPGTEEVTCPKLPDLGTLNIGLYVAPTAKGAAMEALISELRCGFGPCRRSEAA